MSWDPIRIKIAPALLAMFGQLPNNQSPAKCKYIVVESSFPRDFNYPTIFLLIQYYDVKHEFLQNICLNVSRYFP